MSRFIILIVLLCIIYKFCENRINLEGRVLLHNKDVEDNEKDIIGVYDERQLFLNRDTIKVCVVMAFDENYGKEIGYFVYDRNAAWCAYNNYDIYLMQHQSDANIKPHFMRYKALKKKLTEKYELVVYFDGDACVTSYNARLPSNNSLITFGNEFGKFEKEGLKVSTINSGFIMCKNDQIVMDFLDEILTSPVCDDCRREHCGKQRFRDQGCIDKLLTDGKHQNLLKHISFSRVQSSQFDSKLLLIHAAGQTNKKDLVNVLIDHPL